MSWWLLCMFMVARAYHLPHHHLGLWTWPGSLARKVDTQKYIQSQASGALIFFVRVQCLPWHFPEFTALGIPDLGQFCVTTFSTGIKSNKEQLPLCAPAALGEAVLSYLPVFIGMHVGLGAGGHPVRKQVHGLLSREEWLRHTIDTPPSSDSAAGGDKWNVNALALDRFCAHNSPSVIFKQCEVGQVAHPLWASISSLAKRL